MIRTRMTEDHRRCDEFYAQADEASERGDWKQARALTKAFVDATLRHFSVEEEHLFPAFSAATGMSGGPVAVMTMEHGQMRELLLSLFEAAEREDRDSFIGIGDTLLVVMQQHNLKEENVLYPMLDQHVEEAAPMLARLEEP